MRDDFRGRAPDRGMEADSRARGYYDERQDNNYDRSRQDSSRSPPTRARHDDHGRGDSRYRDDGYHERSSGDGRRGGSSGGGYDGGYTGRGSSARHYPRDNHDYGGMYDEGYQYEEERYRGGNSRHRQYDSRSPSGSQHNRSRSHSPMREAGRPTDTVILEGLPFGISASELRESILSNSIAAEFPSIDVRVSSSKGNRRAFVQFQEVDHAVSFMREHFPRLLVELSHSTDDVPDGRFNAFIHYARSRDEGEARGSNDNNWTCPTCDFSNYSSRNKCKVCGGPQTAPNWQQSLTGFTDAADGSSQILVVYPLAPFVNEEMFANDIKRLELEKVDTSKDNSNGAPKLKSTAPGDTTGYGARPGSLYRAFLIRDVITNESLKYGFVEFWTLEDASAAMTKFQRARNFCVAACPVTVSTIHMGVFVPEEREVTPAIEGMSFNPLFNSEIRVRYRDLHVYPSQHIVTSQPPNDGLNKASDEAAEAKKSKKRKADGSLPAAAAKKSVPMAGQMAMWQKKRNELRGEAGSGLDGPQDANDGQGAPRKSGLELKSGPIKISLSGATSLGAPQPASSATRSVSPQGQAAATNDTNDGVSQASENTPVSYVDRERLMCLICMRKYKSVDEVNIHEKSRNHKTATENEDLVKAALPRLAIRDKRMQKQQAQEDGNSDSAQNASSQYRDRAKERRQAYSQPTKPAAQSGKAKTDASNRPAEKAGGAAAATAQPSTKPAAQSKGAGMLAKMGWSAGAGLGAGGDGRTEVIATNAYQEGVGLGAEGGNLGDAAQLAERKTKNSYTDYVNTVQDKARERYNKMG